MRNTKLRMDLSSIFMRIPKYILKENIFLLPSIGSCYKKS